MRLRMLPQGSGGDWREMGRLVMERMLAPRGDGQCDDRPGTSERVWANSVSDQGETRYTISAS
jgi:hypothetical protein